VHRTFLTARFSRQQNREFAWFAGGVFGAARERGADLGKSLEGGAYAGVRFALSEHLQIGGGAGVFTRLEDNPLVIPVFSLEWELADGWTLSSGARPGLTLSYAPTDAWTLSLGGAYQFRDFRLDKDGAQPDGVAQESGWDVALGVEYHPNRQVEVGAGLGWTIARNLTLLDSGGNEIADVDVDAAPFLSAQLTIRF
jgi:hypothetical protein